MTVTAKTTWVQYTGTGSVDTYDYDWRILDEGDIVVVQTDTDGTDTTLALTTDYTVTGVDDVDGGTVVLTSPLASGYTLTIYMAMDITQPLDLTNQDAFFLEGIETGLDRLALQQQQLNTSLARCVQLPATSESTGDELGDLLLAVEDYADSAEASATSAAADAATASAAVGRLTYTETVSGSSKATFDLPFNYEYADDAITVFIDGVYQHPDSYTCTDANTVTMDDAVEVGQVVTFMSSTLGAPDLGTNFADLTLSNLSSAATARTNLGLGTAATVDTGTSSGNVPALGAGGKLASAVYDFASEAEAEAGTDTAKPMNALRVAQAISALAGGGGGGGVIYATRLVSAANGSVDYTISGETRTPVCCIIFAVLSGAGSIGASDGTHHTLMFKSTSNYPSFQTDTAVYAIYDSSNYHYATASMITGGVRLAWTKTGSTGTTNLLIIPIF